MHRPTLTRLVMVGGLVAVVFGALWAAESGAQAVSKTVLSLFRVYAIDPPLEVIGGVETEPVRTGRVESIDGGDVLVSHGVRTPDIGSPDAGFLAVQSRGLVLDRFAASDTCSPVGSLSLTNNTTSGALVYCNEAGRPIVIGNGDAWPYYSSPAGLGNQGPPNERVFTTFPPLTRNSVRVVAINAAISEQGAGAGQVAFLTLRQRYLDGGFQEVCRLPINCDGPLANGNRDAGFYQGLCSGTLEPNALSYLAYSSDGGCSANPYTNGSIFYERLTVQ